MAIFIGLAFALFNTLKLKANIYNHQFAIIIPWSLILIMVNLDISRIHKALGEKTILVIFIFLASYLAFSKIQRLFKKKNTTHLRSEIFVRNKNYILALSIYIALTILNIILAGYIPLIELIVKGNSRYLEFGISGVYGVYNAFSNALAILSLYLYLKTGSRKYLFTTLLISAIFVLFMSRQNLISVLVESFIIFGFVRGYISRTKVILFAITTLLVFAALGELRSGDIKEIVEAKDNYSFLPSALFWLYSYFYISAVNLNNAIYLTGAPYYDGSSLLPLIPNFIKNLLGVQKESIEFLEKSNFNVSTALQPIYSDFGIWEVALCGAIFGLMTQKFYEKSKINQDFKSIATYSVLYFCAFFSCFVNFWFYLPIIFQIPFIYFLSRTTTKSRESLS